MRLFLRQRNRAAPASEQQAGQSLVEFSLMVIFLAVLLMGVLDLGRAYFTYLALKDAAAEGAYFGSAYPQCVDANGLANDSPACAGTHNIPYRVENSAVQGGLVDWSAASINVTVPSLQAGDELTVTVAYQYQLITPFVGAIANSQTLTLTASSAATIIRVPNCTSAAGCE